MIQTKDLPDVPRHISDMIPNQYAELAVIGCFIRDPGQFRLTENKINADHFKDSECRRFFEFFSDLSKKNKEWDDFIFLDRFYEYDTCFTEKMMDLGFNTHFDHYIEIVRLKYIARQLFSESQKLDQVDISVVKKLVDDFYAVDAAEIEIETGKAFDDAVARLEKEGSLIEMPIDYPDLNIRINGLVKGDVIVIAGRPGHSKSMFTTNLICGPLNAGRKVLLADYEMSPMALMQRLTCLFNNIPLNWITKRMTSIGKPEELKEHQKTMAILALNHTKKLFKDQIMIVKQQSFEFLERNVISFKPDILIVDTLQVFAQDQIKEKGMMDSQHISKYCRKLRLMAEKYNINIIQCSQLNIRNDDVIPHKGHMKESGGIEENASVILCVRNREKAYPDNPNENDRYDVAIRKNRHGEEAERNLYNNSKTGRISESRKILSAEEESDVIF